jgi:hypothetical protein
MSTQTMNYDLALRLKNAGFPLRHATKSDDMFVFDRIAFAEPTLEELVKAIEPYTEKLPCVFCEQKIPDGHSSVFRLLRTSEGLWGAGLFFPALPLPEKASQGKWDVETTGPTPTEAVANLWLALNAKEER